MNIDFDNSINVFTDASVAYLSGKSISCPGYAIVYNNKITDASFRIINDSSNNYGEIYALYKGLEAAIRFACEKGYDYRINLISDSQISVSGLRNWIFAWHKKMKHQSIMFSSAKKPIANQYLYKCIVKAIAGSGIPVYIYHQLGHISNTSEKRNLIVDHFKRINLETIDENVASKIIFYNNFVDRYTRNILLSIIGSPVFDAEKYKKEEEDNNVIVSKEDMVNYGRLINKIKPVCSKNKNKEAGLQDKVITDPDFDKMVVSEPAGAILVEPASMERPKKETVPLKIGDIINHRKFGKGVVTAIEDGKWFDAYFESVGSKSLIWGVFDMDIAKIVK